MLIYDIGVMITNKMGAIGDEKICSLIDGSDKLLSALTICSICCYFAIGLSLGIIIIPSICIFLQNDISAIPYVY